MLSSAIGLWFFAMCVSVFFGNKVDLALESQFVSTLSSTNFEWYNLVKSDLQKFSCLYQYPVIIICLPGALLDLILLMPCLLSFCQFHKHFASHLGSSYF